MNAPATPASIVPEAHAPTAPRLVAWHLIHKLVAFDTTSRDSNLALIDCCWFDFGEAFMHRLADRVCTE